MRRYDTGSEKKGQPNIPAHPGQSRPSPPSRWFRTPVGRGRGACDLLIHCCVILSPMLYPQGLRGLTYINVFPTQPSGRLW